MWNILYEVYNSQPEETHMCSFSFCGRSATTAAVNICVIYTDCLDIHKCQWWFNGFCSGNFDIQNAPRCGNRAQFDSTVLQAIVVEYPH